MKLLPWSFSSKERRTPPLARQFVAMDGESLETFLPPESREKKSLSFYPTMACSEANLLDPFFACNGDPQQVIIEEQQQQQQLKNENEDVDCLMLYRTTTSALKRALLLDGDNDVNLNCGMYDSAASALRSALQLGREEEQGKMMEEDDLPLDHTVVMDNNTSSVGATRLTEGGLKHHSYTQLVFASSDHTNEGYNEWKRQHEMKKWWKQTKRRAMERESQGELVVTPIAVDEKQSKKANHQSATIMALATTANPTRPPKWSWFWPKKTVEQSSHKTAGSNPDHHHEEVNTVDTPHVNNAGPTRQETKRDPWIGNPQHADREQKRIQQLREKELQRQRKREADAKKDLPTSSINESHSKSSGNSATTCKNATKRSTAISTIPCSVCSKGKRTHIATPCMHFSFCETCANKLKGAPCPLCGTKNSTYQQVFA